MISISGPFEVTGLVIAFGCFVVSVIVGLLAKKEKQRERASMTPMEGATKYSGIPDIPDINESKGDLRKDQMQIIPPRRTTASLPSIDFYVGKQTLKHLHNNLEKDSLVS
jgi:hypothetical protein